MNYLCGIDDLPIVINKSNTVSVIGTTAINFIRESVSD